MKHYLVCPECAYSTDDPQRKLCEYCRTELLSRCPICEKLIREERAMFCKACGTKLRISYVPIQ